jgi:16S rRNA (uracil1498-N3)-methyltransferase
MLPSKTRTDIRMAVCFAIRLLSSAAMRKRLKSGRGRSTEATEAIMAACDFRAQRLHVPDDLAAGAEIALGREPSHYVLDVIRLAEGDHLLLFNGRDGEWAARRLPGGRKSARLLVETLTRPQPPAPTLELLFAPLKHARLDYMVQKAVEMGAGRLSPVLTQHTQVSRLNRDRMLANAIEAAEQCGVLSVPVIAEERRLAAVLAGWDEARALVFCDEDAEIADPVTALARAPEAPLSVLIGPEGGFSRDEREALLRIPGVVRLSLGPRILRADTAAVAALAVVQAVRGDWRR